jgi:hypothetical protein
VQPIAVNAEAQVEINNNFIGKIAIDLKLLDPKAAKEWIEVASLVGIALEGALQRMLNGFRPVDEVCCAYNRCSHWNHFRRPLSGRPFWVKCAKCGKQTFVIAAYCGNDNCKLGQKRGTWLGLKEPAEWRTVTFRCPYGNELHRGLTHWEG